MRPIARAIEASLSRRARRFVTRQRLKTLERELGLPTSSDADLDTLETLATIASYVRTPIATIIDVGAHQGAFAEPASRVLGADEVVCIEPLRALHESLRARMGNIKHSILPCALSDRPGRASLHVHLDTSMSSLLDVNRTTLSREFSSYDHSSIGAVEVAVSTLDDELRCLSVKPPFLIKLDTQGTELRILHGATRSLQKAAAVLVEHMFTTPYVGASTFLDLVMFMADHGFACAAPTRMLRRSSHKVSAVDLLFVSSNHAG